ncbi:antirestriction protein ArdA [Patescibacteria group bacterium]|nr:antirestriction protein ArdA [Patescibacteria group bacterium]
MKIYAASLTDYNNGYLHGEWIDLEDVADVAALQGRIAAMLRASKFPGCEEWAIHDYEGPRSCQLGEYPDLDALMFQQKMLEKHGDAWAAYMDITDAADASEEDFGDRYSGCFKSEEAWADDFVESTGMLESVPENLRYYFDMAAFARDAEMSGDVDFARGDEGVHVFNTA